MLRPDGWAKPAGQFKVKPTAAACMLYALGPTEISVDDASLAAGGKNSHSRVTTHLKEGGKLC